jgi:formylglycine-generating enzyme required for sulfatase activity
VCVDRWEESAWRIPPTSTRLIARVLAGRATLKDLRAGGATQVGASDPPFNLPPYPDEFPYTGDWTVPIYAVSIPGVVPSTYASWLMAEQACRLSGKRLLTDQEWQAAVAGTPGPCATSGNAPALTGALPGCVSRWGVHDMIGNESEWVAEWSEFASGCESFSLSLHSPPGTNIACYGGDGFTHKPAARFRGGSFADGSAAGAFAGGDAFEPIALSDSLASAAGARPPLFAQ